jgi:hypothetical protein
MVESESLSCLRSLDLSMDFCTDWKTRVDQDLCLKNAWLSCMRRDPKYEPKKSGEPSQCWYPGVISNGNSAVLCNRSSSTKMKSLSLSLSLPVCGAGHAVRYKRATFMLQQAFQTADQPLSFLAASWVFQSSDQGPQ